MNTDKFFVMLLGIAVTFGAVVIVALVLFHQKRLRELENYEKELAVQLRRHKELDDFIERIRFLRHDARNYLITMQSLLTGGQYDKAREFLKEVYVQFGLDSGGIFCDNRLLDELLMDKYGAAHDRGVLCSIHAEIPAAYAFDDMVLCSAVSEVFDRTLEYSCPADHEGQQSGIIDFHCAVTADARLTIECAATTADVPKVKQGATGRKRSLNAYPQKSAMLSSLAETYGGSAEQRYEGGRYTIKLTLYLPRPNSPEEEASRALEYR